MLIEIKFLYADIYAVRGCNKFKEDTFLSL